jgi:hypothetical protein
MNILVIGNLDDILTKSIINKLTDHNIFTDHLPHLTCNYTYSKNNIDLILFINNTGLRNYNILDSLRYITPNIYTIASSNKYYSGESKLFFYHNKKDKRSYIKYINYILDTGLIIYNPVKSYDVINIIVTDEKISYMMDNLLNSEDNLGIDVNIQVDDFEKNTNYDQIFFYLIYEYKYELTRLYQVAGSNIMIICQKNILDKNLVNILSVYEYDNNIDWSDVFKNYKDFNSRKKLQDIYDNYDIREILDINLEKDTRQIKELEFKYEEDKSDNNKKQEIIRNKPGLLLSNLYRLV